MIDFGFNEGGKGNYELRMMDYELWKRDIRIILGGDPAKAEAAKKR